MEQVEKFIIDNKLFKRGEIIGVGCSGGSDSIALLHYLAQNQEKFDIEVVAIHIDHAIRETSYIDADFVKEKAREFGVRYYKFRVDAKKVAQENHESIESGARIARYGVFRSLIERGIVDKIALAHHVSDQAETILMHLFRGAGTSGAQGMSPISEEIFVRPFLDVTKKEILDYIDENRLEYVDDETNSDTNYNRNFVRNELMPRILSRWPNAESAIVNFAKAVKEDDDYINSQVFDDAIMLEEKLVKIPLTYFLYPDAVVSRMIFKAVKALGITKDIERRHLALIKKLAVSGNNGDRLFLPFESIAVKEYDYLTIYDRRKESLNFSKPFEVGDFEVEGFGKVCVHKTKSLEHKEGELVFDYKKLPSGCEWRFRQEGDVFTKFGGGTKKLKSFFIDKKIPSRLRDSIPVLACGNEVYIVAGIEISDKVKVEDEKNMCKISIKK